MSPDRRLPAYEIPDPTRITKVSNALIGLLIEGGDQEAETDGDLLDDLRAPLRERALLDVDRGDIGAAVTYLKITGRLAVRAAGSVDARLTRSRIVGLWIPKPKESSDGSQDG